MYTIFVDTTDDENKLVGSQKRQFLCLYKQNEQYRTKGRLPQKEEQLYSLPMTMAVVAEVKTKEALTRLQ